MIKNTDTELNNTLSSIIHKNKSEILIFTILFLISLSITIYQFHTWEVSSERTKWNSFALFSGDEPSYLEITSTIINHGSLNSDYFYKDHHTDQMLILPQMYYEADSCRLHHAALGRDGHCWSDHQPGLAFLLVPGYALGGAVGAMITMNIMFAVQGIIVLKFLKKFVKSITSMICGLIFSLTTVSLSFSDRIYPDFVAGFLILSAFYFFFARKNNLKNLMATGLLLGFLPFLKTEFVFFSAILLPIMIIILLKRKNQEGSIILVGSFLILILVFGWYLVISSLVQGDTGFGGNYTSLVKDTISTKLDQMKEFLSKGSANLLFGRSYGLFVFSPLALLSLFGIKYVWHSSKILAATILIIMSLFVLALSLTIPYAAGWSLPSRYLLPILPLTVIPFGFLFENLARKIPFQTIVVLTSFIGTSSNIILARIIYAHPTVQMRADIANQVYLGGANIFPFIGVSSDFDPTNFWNSSGPFFWIFLAIIITSFSVFTLYSKMRITISQLTPNKKIILFSLVSISLIIGIIYACEVVYVYQVEMQITELYHKILGRTPDINGLTYWKNEVLNDGKSLDWVEETMSKSPEGLVTIKITSFYSDILHRQPDPVGLTYWKNEVLNDGKSLDWVEEMMKNSTEAHSLQK